jgi:hypothetical protein
LGGVVTFATVMKKLDLGQTVSIVANLGVIAGIAFLAIEINQANQLARSQTRSEISSSLTTLVQELASDPELAALWVYADDPDSLSESENAQLYLSWVALFRIWENMHYQYRNGLFEDAEFEAEREVWRASVQDEYFRRFFCRVNAQFSPDFIREIEALMPSSDCETAN